MTGYTPPFYLEQFRGADDKPLAGGSLNFYVAGSTSLPKQVYGDLALTIPYTSIVLDAAGKAPQYFTEAGLYKIVIKDRYGAIVDTRDNVAGDGGASNGVGDHKVLVAATDTTAGYLASKLRAGSGVNIIPSAPNDDMNLTIDIDGRLAVSSADTYKDYLENKLVDSSTVDITKETNQVGQQVLKANVNIDSVQSYKVKVTDLDTNPAYLIDKLYQGHAITISNYNGGMVRLDVDESQIGPKAPIGAAGGDLGATYPNPTVRHLSGDAYDEVQVGSPIYGSSQQGRAIGSGKIFVNNIETDAMIAMVSDGDMFISTNGFGTYNADHQFRSDNTYNLDMSVIRFIYLATKGGWCWVLGSTDAIAYFYQLHIPANYNSNGTFKNSWVMCDNSDISTAHNNIRYLVQGKANRIYTADKLFAMSYSDDGHTWSLGLTTATAIGGIAADGSGTVLAVEVGTGRIYRSYDNSATWTAANLIVNGVATGTPNLPVSANQQWNNATFINGLWVISAYTGPSTHIWVAYSNDTINWTTTTDSAIVNLFGFDTDGAYLYGITTTVPALIYKVAVNNIHSDKQIVADNGIVLGADSFIPELPNATLCTDARGKIISGASISGKVLATNTDIVQGYLIDKIKPGAGITITTASDVNGDKLVINARGQSWRLVKYVTTNYNIVDSDDNLIIRGTGITLTLPTPVAAYEGRVVTVRCAGGVFSGTVLGNNILPSSPLMSNYDVAEFMCFYNGSTWIWSRK